MDEEAKEAKQSSVIDMALTYSAMVRIFEAGSKKKIVGMLKDLLEALESVKSTQEYLKLHSAFCKKFTNKIKTAERKLKNGNVIKRKRASYGQAAKVLDVSAKVYVYYCRYPDDETSNRLSRYLSGAIDTPILKYLKEKYPSMNIKAKTIADVKKVEYKKLQRHLEMDKIARFQDGASQVQYDDILWNELNREKQ